MNPNISGFWPQWTVEYEIGRGSFGSVYRISRDLFGKRSYSAMKVLRIPQNLSEIQDLRAQGMFDASIRNFFQEQCDMLKDEIVLMNELKSSANIVSIEDFYREQNRDGFGWTFYIRMELLESLPDYMLRCRMSVREAVLCARDIASALESCENARIIHRDVKPGNIFRNRDGLFKLGDFGIARQLDYSTGAHSIVGTPNFEAPEVAFGRPYGHSADIYSLGLVLFVLLNNGQRPFIKPSAENISYKEMLEANRRRLGGEALPKPANADAMLAGILKKACAYDAVNRYRHAADFKDALNQWLFTKAEGNRVVSGPEKGSDRTAPISGPVRPGTSGGVVGISFCRAGSSRNYTISASGSNGMNPVTKRHLALSAETFRDFREAFGRSFGRNLEGTVIAMPDGWSWGRKSEVRKAARTAGFSKIQQVSQTAAFAAFYLSGDPAAQNCLSVSCHSDRVDAALYSISGKRLIKQGFFSAKNRLKGLPIAPSLIVEAAKQAVSDSGLTEDRIQSVVTSGLPGPGDLLQGLFPMAKRQSLPEHAGSSGALLAFPFMHHFTAPPVDRISNTLGLSAGTSTGFHPFIRRGSPLPARGAETLILKADARGCVTVSIMEAEAADQQDPGKVCEYIFSDRSIEPNGNFPLRLYLRAEPDGSLDLTATDPETGRVIRPVSISKAALSDPGTSKEKR